MLGANSPNSGKSHSCWQPRWSIRNWKTTAPQGIRQSLGIAERILICLTPRTNPVRMLTSGHRNAERFHGDLIAVTVGQPDLSAEKKAFSTQSGAARNAGAEVVIFDGEDAIETILRSQSSAESLRFSSATACARQS